MTERRKHLNINNTWYWYKLEKILLSSIVFDMFMVYGIFSTNVSHCHDMVYLSSIVVAIISVVFLSMEEYRNTGKHVFMRQKNMLRHIHQTSPYVQNYSAWTLKIVILYLI